MLNRAKPLSNNNSWADESQSKSPKMKHSDQEGALRKPLWEEQSLQNAKIVKRTTKPLRGVLTEEGLAKKQHSENTNKWRLCKASSFSYDESSRTPPLEGTSLHRWNNSMEEQSL